MDRVTLDHMKAFQECMDSYGIHNGVPTFNAIALAIAFYESTCIHLIVTKSGASNHVHLCH